MATKAKSRRVLVGLGMLCVALTGCQTVIPENPYDLLVANMPRTVLVLPPTSESLDINAPYSFLTTMSRPLGEQGYYVYPVAVVDAFMKDNGLPTPAEMHNVPLKKLDEIIGPDAVMYVNITEFGQKYELLRSSTKISATAKLVDVKTEQVIWTNKVDLIDSSSSNGQGGLLGDVLTAAISQVGDTIIDKSHDAAKIANYRLLRYEGEGLLPGPLHPEHDEAMIAASEDPKPVKMFLGTPLY